MLAAVRAEIDQAEGCGEKLPDGGEQGSALAGECEHAAVVGRIGRTVEQVYAADARDRAGHRVNAAENAALADIGHAFDDAHQVL